MLSLDRQENLFQQTQHPGFLSSYSKLKELSKSLGIILLFSFYNKEVDGNKEFEPKDRSEMPREHYEEKDTRKPNNKIIGEAPYVLLHNDRNSPKVGQKLL